MAAKASATENAQALIDYVKTIDQCVVAYSGGVDSAVVAKASHLALGDRARAITAVSPSLATKELAIAKRVADAIGIRLQLIETEEIQNESYRRNQGDRCYYCKSELYSRIESIVQVADGVTILNGTNKDDLSDHRPGLVAAQQFGVKSPLSDLGLGKDEVRAVAANWGLEVWNKPASPCLSSRVAYGVTVTVEKLRRIEASEAILHDLGFEVVRVRHLSENQARIEVPLDRLDELIKLNNDGQIDRQLYALGFSDVTIDERGFRSGSLNDALARLTHDALSTDAPATEAPVNEAAVNEAAALEVPAHTDQNDLYQIESNKTEIPTDEDRRD